MKGIILDANSLGLGDPGMTIAPLKLLLDNLDVYDSSSPGQVAERIKDAEVVLVNKVNLDRTAILSAPHLRFISVMATGTDNIDLDAASEKHIAVANATGYATASVAEHTIALMLTLARNFPRYLEDTANGHWQRSESFCLLNHPVNELNGKTLGIIGYGNLGKAVTGIARALGMQIMPAEHAGSDTIRIGRYAFEDVLKHSDLISLHCPLTEETKNIINSDTLSMMKKNVLLINTARGGLVDTSALIKALRDNTIGGAALDVLTTEPPPRDEPLLNETIPNLVVTPHNAWGAIEARQRLILQMKENIEAFLAGKKLRRVV